MTKRSRRSWLGNILVQLDSHYLALGLIFLMALALRLAFFAGTDGKDEVLYANSALALLQGQVNANLEQGAGRIGHFGPVGLLYFLFGPSLEATLAWPLLCSLLTLWLIYKIVEMLAGSRAGLLAAFVLAVMPIAVSNATRNYPDGPMAMLAAAAVYFWLKAQRSSGRKALFFYLLSALFPVWGLWVKQQIVLVLGFLVIALILNLPRVRPWLMTKLRQPILAGCLIAAGLLFLGLYGNFQLVSFPKTLAVTSLDVFGFLSTDLNYYFLLPWLVVLLILQLREGKQETFFLAFWFGFIFLALEWVPMALNPSRYVPSPIRPLVSRSFIFMMLPVAGLLGVYLARASGERGASRTVSLASVAILAGLAFYKLGLDENLSLALSSVAVFVFAALAFWLPSRMNARRLGSGYLLLALVTLGWASINSLGKELSYRYYEWVEFLNLRETANLLSESDTPIYFYDQEDRRRINHMNFLSGYKLTPRPFNEISGRVHMFALPAEVDENAYVVVLDPNFLNQTSPTWWEVATFTRPRTRYVSNPPQVHVFRALSAETARQNLTAAQAAYASQPDAASLLDLFSAAASANEPQLAFEAWRELSTLDPDAARYKDQLIALFRQNLDTTEAGTNLLLNGDFGVGLEGWDLSEADALGIDVEMEGDAVHLVNAADQPAIPLSQSLHLKPETVYAFSVELKGQGALAPLYWSHPDVEGSYPAELSAETYSQLVYIFITPVWEEYEPALLAPIAFLGAGEVWLRQASLTELGGAQ